MMSLKFWGHHVINNSTVITRPQSRNQSAIRSTDRDDRFGKKIEQTFYGVAEAVY